MQYHLEGFRAGDPSNSPEGFSQNSENVDVLIIGCGPAGLTLATQLSILGDISVRLVESKSGPLEVGRADGIACRSVEMFEAFGFSERVIKEAYQVNEVSIWQPGSKTGSLVRSERFRDVEDDLSEMPHLILSQARIHDFYLETMQKSAIRLMPEYSNKLLSLERDDASDYPIEAKIARLQHGGLPHSIRAKYVVGCDGARSRVRSEIGFKLRGRSARQLWGVMDVLPKTDFPDIRLKCAIKSADQGSILIIPREGGYMVRLYIELDELASGERAVDRQVSPELLIEKARKILSPYEFNVAQVAWWSVYEIGQRVCDQFDDGIKSDRGNTDPRIFIAGDACHTHSPKAGQGMNVSMADAFNLGWKLAAVLRGQSFPSLLETYSAERRAMAHELIEFDRKMVRLFSEKPTNRKDTERFQRYIKKHGRYTAGVETRYGPSIITGGTAHQILASGYVVGKRFHSAPVIRLADAKPMELGHVLKADGRWRVIIFAPKIDTGSVNDPVPRLCNDLGDLIESVTRSDADVDSVIDVRAVFQCSHQELNVSQLPSLLRPQKGPFGLTDYEKAYCARQSGKNIFDMRGIDRLRGAAVVVRPDHYVSFVGPIEDSASVVEFFGNVMRQPTKSNA